MQIIKEFKKFALKGNAMDLAVGVVIGAAFGRITSSLVEDIINPPLGLITGNIDFNEKVLVLRQATETASAVTINYGSFITALINFLIISFVIFLVVKQINRLKDKEEKKPTPPPAPSEDVIVLKEIRDILANK